MGFQLLKTEDGFQLNQFQMKEVRAILDMKWCHYCPADTPVFGVVDASGRLSMNKVLPDDDSKFTCTEVGEVSVGEDRLALSLDWSTGQYHRWVIYIPYSPQ